MRQLKISLIFLFIIGTKFFCAARDKGISKTLHKLISVKESLHTFKYCEKGFLFGSPKADSILVFDYTTYGFTYETGRLLEIRNAIKIAQYKDYLAYRLTTIINNNEAIDFDGTNVTAIRTYRYFVVKKGSKNGLLFRSDQQPKVFSYQKVLEHDGLNFKDLDFFQLNLGIPDEIVRNERTKDLEIEKFANKIKGRDEPDSIYRYYDKNLNSVNFSFNPSFDEKACSKLWKIGLIYKIPKGITKSDSVQRKEAYWKITKSSSEDYEHFFKIFKEFIAEKKKYNLE